MVGGLIYGIGSLYIGWDVRLEDGVFVNERECYYMGWSISIWAGC